LNTGTSLNLNNFPDIQPIEKPIRDLNLIINYNWLAGFSAGDGSFFVSLVKANDHKLKVRVLIFYVIGLNRIHIYIYIYI
jgi:hypothetical protein